MYRRGPVLSTALVGGGSKKYKGTCNCKGWTKFDSSPGPIGRAWMLHVKECYNNADGS